ncbi:hypothetical protein LBMAG47_18110 [Planctomycetia bacterium]|jgi:hypothetical protein|nr:hypothetical protein LBMAG47_18110 [Planctomycetia bacterium]
MNVIAYDLGTGGMKASLYGPEGECLASHFAPYDTHYPQSGCCASSVPTTGGPPPSRQLVAPCHAAMVADGDGADRGSEPA